MTVLYANSFVNFSSENIKKKQFSIDWEKLRKLGKVNGWKFGKLEGVEMPKKYWLI